MFGLLNRIISNEEPTNSPGLANTGLGFLSTPKPPFTNPGLNVLRPRTPLQGPVDRPRMPAPFGPSTSVGSLTGPVVPEVDMSGLTEEEKALIQSVMMRAQTDSSLAPQPLHADTLNEKNKMQYSPKPQQNSNIRAQEIPVSSQRIVQSGMQYPPSSQPISNQRQQDQPRNPMTIDRLSHNQSPSQNIPHQSGNRPAFSQPSNTNRMQEQTSDERLFQKPLIHDSASHKPSNIDKAAELQYQTSNHPTVSAHQSDSYSGLTNRTGMQQLGNQMSGNQQIDAKLASTNSNQASSFNPTHNLPHAPTAADFMPQKNSSDDRIIQSGLHYPSKPLELQQHQHNLQQKQELSSISQFHPANQQGSNQSIISVAQHNMSINSSNDNPLFQPPSHTLPQIPHSDYMSKQMETDHMSQLGIQQTQNTQFLTNLSQSTLSYSKPMADRPSNHEQLQPQNQPQELNLQQSNYSTNIDDRFHRVDQVSQGITVNERVSHPSYNLSQASIHNEHQPASQHVSNEQRCQSGIQMSANAPSIPVHRRMDQSSDLRSQNDNSSTVHKPFIPSMYQQEIPPTSYSSDRSYYSHQLPHIPASNNRSNNTQSYGVSPSMDHTSYPGVQDTRSSEFYRSNDRKGHLPMKDDRISHGQQQQANSEALSNVFYPDQSSSSQRSNEPRNQMPPLSVANIRQSDSSFSTVNDNSMSRLYHDQQAIQNQYLQAPELSPIQDVSPSVESAEAKRLNSSGSFSQNKDPNQSDFNRGLPRVTSGTLTGILADFNKQMEQLSNISPVEDKNHSVINHAHRRASLPATSIEKSLSVSSSKSHSSSTTKGIKRTSSLSDSNENKENRKASSEAPAKPPSNLAIPSKTKYEKAISPVVEQTLHQQKLLIQQQQEFIQIQKEIYAQQQKHQEEFQKVQKLEDQNKHPTSQVQTSQTQSQQSTVTSLTDSQTQDKKKTAVDFSEEEGRRVRDHLAKLEREKNAAQSQPNSSCGKKDRRRLPQPTIEEMKGAVQAISNQGTSSALTGAIITSVAPVSTIAKTGSISQISNRPVSPVIPRKNHVTAVPIISPVSRTRIPASTVLTTATHTVMSSSIATSSSHDHHPHLSSLDSNLLSNLNTNNSLIARLLTPLKLTEISDTQSESGGKKRRLPPVPLDEEPVTAALASRRLLRERLNRSATLAAIGSKPGLLLRSFSSMDNVPRDFIGPFSPKARSIVPGNISPVSSLSEFSNFLNLSGLDKQLIAKNRALANALPSTLHGSGIPASFVGSNTLPFSSPASPSHGIHSSSYLKSLRGYFRDGLRSALDDHSRILDLYDKHCDLYKKSDADLLALKDDPLSHESLLGRKALMQRLRPPLLKGGSIDGRIFDTPTGEEIPSGRLKSYEYEYLDPTFHASDTSLSALHSSLHPTSRALRSHFGPVYSRTPLLSSYMNKNLIADGYQSRLDKGLSEGLVSNILETDDLRLMNDPILARRLRGRRRSEGSLDESFTYDTYPRNTALDDINSRFSKPLAASTGLTQSWHPSPYGSEDEEDKLTREEKAAKLRAEIARRKAYMMERTLSEDYDSLIYPKDEPSNFNKPEYPAAYIGDYYGQRQVPANPRRAALSRESRLSRSLDGYDDYSYNRDLSPYRGRGYGRSSQFPGKNGPYGSPMPHQSHQSHQVSPAQPKRPKYLFPVKKILLTRDPNNRSQDGVSCFGLKLAGGYEIPGSNGMIGAFVEQTFVGGVADSLGDIREGDLVLEWNGIPLIGLNNNDVQRIISSTNRNEEVEVLLRRDFNLFDPYMDNMQPSVDSSMQYQGVQQNSQYIQDTIYPADFAAYKDQIGDAQMPHNSQVNMFHQPHQQNLVDADGYSINQLYGEDAASQQQQQQQQQQAQYTFHDAQCPQNYLNQQNQAQNRANYNQYSMQAYGPAIDQQNVATDYTFVPEWESTQAQQIPNHQQSIEENVSLNENYVQYYKKRDYEACENPLKAISGQIQLQICYDHKAAILYVTIIQAQELSMPNGEFPDPFVKCYLLPPRIIENQRRTRYCRQTCNPEWKQTMVYPQIEKQDLKRKYLEITIWSYNPSQNHLFLGQVILHLSDPQIYNEEATWFILKPPDDDEQYNNHQEDWTTDRKRNRQVQAVEEPEVHLDFRPNSANEAIYATRVKRFRFPGNKILQALSQKHNSNAPRTTIPKQKTIMN